MLFFLSYWSVWLKGTKNWPTSSQLLEGVGEQKKHSKQWNRINFALAKNIKNALIYWNVYCYREYIEEEFFFFFFEKDSISSSSVLYAEETTTKDSPHFGLWSEQKAAH